jgi:hypothetical protein
LGVGAAAPAAFLLVGAAVAGFFCFISGNRRPERRGFERGAADLGAAGEWNGEAVS